MYRSINRDGFKLAWRGLDGENAMEGSKPLLAAATPSGAGEPGIARESQGAQ